MKIELQTPLSALGSWLHSHFSHAFGD